MPNLLWFEWEKDVDGYRIEELEPEDAAGKEGKTPHLVSIGRAALRYRPLDEHPGMFMEFGYELQNIESAKTFSEKYGLLESTDRPMSLSYWRHECGRMRGLIEAWKGGVESVGDLRPVIRLFNHLKLAPLSVMFEQAWDSLHPALYIVPNNLLSALWLQFAQAVSSNTEFRKCLHCPAWFTYGSGTGRRKTAFYCSARCRRAAHRSKEKRR